MSFKSPLFHSSEKRFPRIVIFLTNHTNDDRGDLYIGPNHSGTVDVVSGIIILLFVHVTEGCGQFMKALLPIADMAFLGEADVTMWIMSCGSLVRTRECLNELSLAANT
jgi:hypothetical protein